MVEDNVPECIGDYGRYGLSCGVCRWAEECIEFQAEAKPQPEVIEMYGGNEDYGSRKNERRGN